MEENLREDRFGTRTEEMDKHGYVRSADRLEQDIADLELCLAGNSRSKKWQEIKVILTNKKQELLHMKRRLAGRTPQMESWADPLPGTRR